MQDIPLQLLQGPPRFYLSTCNSAAGVHTVHTIPVILQGVKTGGSCYIFNFSHSFPPHTNPVIAAVSKRKFVSDRHHFVSCHTLHFVLRSNEAAILFFFFSFTSTYQFCADDRRASVLLPHQIHHLLFLTLAERYQTMQCCTKTVRGKLVHHLVLFPRPLSRKSIPFIA